MNASGCYRHRMNRLALIFFIAAVVCFVVFQFIPNIHDVPGWHLWRNLYHYLTRGYWRYSDVKSSIGASSFVMMSLLIVVSPALIPIISRTPQMRWLVCMMSLIAGVGLVLMAARVTEFQIIFLAVFLHLLGCLCIRRPKPEEFVPASHPDA